MAQTGIKCHMPQQWEAYQVRFDPNERPYHNHTSAYRTRARYTYDGLGLRKRRVEEFQSGGADNYYDIIELFNEKKAYVTDLKSKVCTIYEISAADFHPHDIPSDAQFTGNEIIGSYPDQVELSQWFKPNASYYGGVSDQYLTFTVGNCVPVRDDRWNNATGFHYEEFSDVTVGLSDPNVFIPPSGCTPAPPSH
eukprot:CAMPEP_0170549502 /NCGR_PEP_ID=MMETSP0211-20121228/7652_1 /TAXON_ID=311385 /ORGANISM="Pseudokeronopsis sp., Strain OXSARD2" /LENGTH=193 /DNA_ID=CAMNT_0010855551 /DNA_START=10 /DNA_END=591 /DNA_ORIENTATION=-